MKVVLVNPPLTTEERYGVHFQSGGKTPPLGLACLAAVLQDHQIDVRIVDGAISNDYTATVADILSGDPDVVGVTASTVSIHNAAEVARLVKDADESVVTLIGGPHITATPVATMKQFPSFDIGVLGEAEETIVDLIDYLRDAQSPRNARGPWSVGGLILRTDNGVVRTSQRTPIADLDTLPFPAWELLPELGRHYCPPVHTVKQLPAALLVTSRGCPARCTFCDRSVFGHNMRAYSAEYVMAMIRDLYYNYGIREFQFRDDNFLAFRPQLVELCRLLIEEKLGISWSLAGRVDMVNPEILGMLAEAGCWQIWYGVESGSQRILDVINKQTKLGVVQRAVQQTRDAGISPCGFFMLGMPTETVDDIETTIRFSRELPLDEAHFTFFTPMPGSEVYETVEQYGELDADWKRTNCWNPVFMPTGMTEQQLVKLWKRATLGFYLRPRIVWGYLRRIRSWRHVRIYLSGVLALLESVFVKRYQH
ncbi:MAG: B12-binding domain-containing radical SAM protein [Candidatus Bathyanammoxibius sp.]